MSGIHYVARLQHVREVTLTGLADLEYWTEMLRAEGLAPLEVEGQAEILIVGADARFRGLRFQELSVSVSVARQGPYDPLDRAFLIHAFNSRRFFAWTERALFSTPYQRAGVDVSLDPPSLRLDLGGRSVLEGVCSGTARPEPNETQWNGTVFLPSGSRRRFFFARMEGAGEKRAFVTGDRFALDRSAASVLRRLGESQFQPRAWIVRPSAHHARSRTYRQSWRDAR